jgi:drug/metabolite transporter (DMT)-like permease
MSQVDTAVSAAAPSRPDVAALVAGLFTVTLWGSAFVGIRAAGAAFSPGSLALARLLVSCVVLGAVALVRRDPLPRVRDLGRIAVYGILWLAVYSTALNAAERIVDAGTAALLINVGPILVAILAGVFLGEGFPPRLFVGCAIAFGGCALIGFATTQNRVGAGMGIALLGAAVLAYSTAIVVQKPVLARVPPFQVTFMGVLAATIVCLPFAPNLASELGRASAGAITWTIYLGAFPTAIGFATWGFALRRTKAGQLGTLTYLAPVVAVLLSWMVLRESPPWLAIIGGMVALVGVYVARRAPARAKPARVSSQDR